MSWFVITTLTAPSLGLPGGDRVVARGAIRIGWVEDARVRAGGDILIGSHATRATIHADGVVRVERSEGPKGGVICGGDILGFSGIQTQVAGSNAYKHDESDGRHGSRRRQEA